MCEQAYSWLAQGLRWSYRAQAEGAWGEGLERLVYYEGRYTPYHKVFQNFDRMKWCLIQVLKHFQNFYNKEESNIVMTTEVIPSLINLFFHQPSLCCPYSSFFKNGITCSCVRLRPTAIGGTTIITGPPLWGSRDKLWSRPLSLLLFPIVGKHSTRAFKLDFLVLWTLLSDLRGGW